jgi:hypothetical protein
MGGRHGVPLADLAAAAVHEEFAASFAAEDLARTIDGLLLGREHRAGSLGVRGDDLPLLSVPHDMALFLLVHATSYC